jgi:DNA-binding XRE family transcriptional regulator
MQVHVKMRHIKIDITGDIHPRIISVLKELYGKKLKVTGDDDSELVDVFKTDWYKTINVRMTPGKSMKAYREIHRMTQEELGRKMGGISKQNISHMERGIRSISKANAKLLAKIFDVPVDRFI